MDSAAVVLEGSVSPRLVDWFQVIIVVAMSEEVCRFKHKCSNIQTEVAKDGSSLAHVSISFDHSVICGGF